MFQKIPCSPASNSGGFIYKVLPSSYFPSDNPEIYINVLAPYSNKNWRKHLITHTLIKCITGSVIFSISEDIAQSTIYTINIEQDSSFYLIIEPLTWFSFKSISDVSTSLLCASTLPHDPQEIIWK